MGKLPAQLFFKWGFELQGAEPTPDQTAFGLSFPGLCAGGEFYLVHKPDKLRFRFEPHSYSTYRGRACYFLCGFYLNGLCRMSGSNSSRWSQARPLSTTHSCCDPSSLDNYTLHTDMSKWSSPGARARCLLFFRS